MLELSKVAIDPVFGSTFLSVGIASSKRSISAFQSLNFDMTLKNDQPGCVLLRFALAPCSVSLNSIPRQRALAGPPGQVSYGVAGERGGQVYQKAASRFSDFRDVELQPNCY